MKCFTPQIDYFEQDVFDSLSFSQIAEVGNTVYFSGIAPLKGSLENTLVMGQSIEEQLEFILATAQKCLESVGLAFSNIATWTIYTTEIDAFANQSGDILKKYLGQHKPVCTLVQISKLIHPEQMIEITITAVKE